ncbi:uncharacterized protein LOC134227651 [Armigeres subalbatus]|uniref:uncharacterized protein LOC134227651 n=1 Tax=Armigeres subalbatus TaxID=124917 RepID=UPI002ED1DA8C
MKQLVWLVLLIIINGSLSSAHHEYREVAEECVEYLKICPSRLEQYLSFVFPEDRDTMCFIRCVASKFQVWSDKDGLNWSLLEARLGPSVQEHTDDCVCRKLERVDPYDHCPRAYYACRCLRDYLPKIFHFHGHRFPKHEHAMHEHRCHKCSGECKHGCSRFHSHEPKGPGCHSCSNSFKPLTITEMMHKLVGCAKKCKLHSLNLCDRSTDPVVDTPEFECTVYCAGICTGVYSEQKGILMDNLYAQLGQCETRESFDYRLELCYSRNAQPEGTSPQSVVYKQYLKCLRGDYERFFSSHREEMLLFPGVAKYCH